MCFASSIIEAHRKLFIAPPDLDHPDPATPTISSKIKMSRGKSRLQTEVCGDCGAGDPSWASINRGILLCADCCSVHRSLGRHISIVKSLRQGNWEPSVLNFVNSLNAHGANSVWEHHLLDGSTNSTGGKHVPRWRKPTPKDALHPTKSDFIKAKHVHLTFVLKPSLQDDDDGNGSPISLEQELSRQLHASVRTSNLETSLRFLVQGADPNYYHEDKLSTPLHMAAKFGQASQIEMLLIYGADVNALDGNGMTPLELARANNHNTIADRLLEAMYDVTDRIITFLGGKKPDHASGRHLIIPDANGADISEQLKIARGKLQLVPNKMFEELVMDLYDEVDRRECEAIWSTSTLNAEHATVPFLPANPFLSATRNQGRQKLARFNRAEFTGLLTDVLVDALRRQNMANLRPLDAPMPGHQSLQSLPYANNSMLLGSFEQGGHDPNLSDDEPIYDPVASDDDYAPVPPMAQQAIVHTPPRNANSHNEMETLRKQLSDYKSEINQLKNVVQMLSSENSQLKSKFSSASNNSVYDEPLRIDLSLSSPDTEHEPLSLPEGGTANMESGSSNDSSNQSTIKRPASMYERRLVPNVSKGHTDIRNTTSMYQMAGDGKPFGEEVKVRSDLVTRCLKELIKAMQPVPEDQKQSIAPHGELIRSAVTDLIALYANLPSNASDTTRETLKLLTRQNILIQHECENLQKAIEADDKQAIQKNTLEVRDCAFHIASAIKTLVLQFY
ncbi:ARF GTPase-activating protein GIT2 [Drosophila eugracilis]|uniref:ARF GTPase-activating protein GIT2 n=1 Tax=Drosophila eugracilis TaxID=29029 RepID=UPI0007E5FF42|nr:ARF GTPase-activating protein GIT2 [Drosophila eugracilis]XP_017077433.1 ARF GTPase-activating protein GIT2 [Drosophila eugracilis]